MISPRPLPPLASRAMDFAICLLLASEHSILDPDVWDCFCTVMSLCHQRSVLRPNPRSPHRMRIRQAVRTDYERANAELANAIVHYRRRAGLSVDRCTTPSCHVCRPGITKDTP